MSRPRLVIATRNPHKLSEIRAVLADLDLQMQGADEFPGCPEVEEDGDTLEANAEKKAREVASYTGLLTLADDSGLEVEALRGAPGVYSARYAGAGCSFADNNHKLLDALTDKRIDAERLARFRCVMALVDPAWGPAYADAGTRGPAEFAPRKTHPGRLEMFEGRIDGVIAREPQGAEGFGYDPVFFIPAEGCTMAELSTEQKNRISHRAQALKAVRAALLRRLA
jgi:XTP/dITP diphosphohydrolase